MLLNKIKKLISVFLGLVVISSIAYAQTSQDALIQRYLERQMQNLMKEISKQLTKI